jgi:hypothetical protein
LRATETGPYGEDVGHYVALWERKTIARSKKPSRAGLTLRRNGTPTTAPSSKAEAASGTVEASYSAYLAAPYGLTFRKDIR